MAANEKQHDDVARQGLVAIAAAKAVAVYRKMAAATLLYLFGLVLLLIGERIFGAGTGRWTSLAGVLAMLGGVGWRVGQRGQVRGDAQRAEKMVLALYLVGIAGVALYFLQSDLSGSVFQAPLEKSSPKLAGVLGALWPAVLLTAVIALHFVELAYAAVARAPKIEIQRIEDALYSGLGLAGALVFAFAFAYVASERDKKIDFSYQRTAKPGESTRKIAQTLDQPVQVAMFFPPANEVREEVAGYFDDLKQESKFLEVNQYDHAVEPVKAKDLGVSGNGIVVIARGGRKEQLSIGLQLESARSQLRNLDREVQKRLLQVAKPARNVYIVTGHGERSSFPANETDKRGTIRQVREVLTQLGYTVKDLGAAEGLASDVPPDASTLLILGPQQDLAPEEIGALKRFWDKGGRFFIAVDPEEKKDWKALLEPFGLTFSPTPLANDQMFARRTNQQSDRLNLVTGSYSSHPSVTTLGRLGMRAPSIFVGAGALDELKDKPKDLTIDFPVRANPQTWNDLNGDFAFAAPEVKKAYYLAAAVVNKKPGQKPEENGRALVFSDSDLFTDEIIANLGIRYLLFDGMKWLVGDESITGEITSEQDIPIAHTQKQDKAWFYAITFLVPGLVVAFGAMMVGRRRSKKNKDKESKR
jgi:hypothetical protein